MKKVLAVIFAAAMLASIPFIGSSIGSSGDASISAQTVTVKRKRKRGIARRTYRGGKYVVRRTWDGTKWVSKKGLGRNEVDRPQDLERWTQGRQPFKEGPLLNGLRNLA